MIIMEITQTNINEFYNLVQDQISKITTKEGLDFKNLTNNIMTNLDYLISFENYESENATFIIGEIIWR